VVKYGPEKPQISFDEITSPPLLYKHFFSARTLSLNEKVCLVNSVYQKGLGDVDFHCTKPSIRLQQQWNFSLRRIK